MTTSDSIGRSNSLSPSAKLPFEPEPKRESLETIHNRDSEIGIAQDSRVARRSPPPPSDGVRGRSGRVRQRSLTSSTLTSSTLTSSTKSKQLQERNAQVVDKKEGPDTKWGRFKQAIADFFKWIFGGCLNIRERKVEVPEPSVETEDTMPLDPETIAMRGEKLNQMTIVRIRDYGDLLEQLGPQAQQKYRTQLTIMMEGYNAHASKQEWTEEQVQSMLNAFKAMDALFQVYLADDIRNFVAGKYEKIVEKKKTSKVKGIALKNLEKTAASQVVKLTPRVQMLQKLIAKRVEMYDKQAEELNDFKKSLYNTRIMTANYCIDGHKDGTELSEIEIKIAKATLETIDRMFGNEYQSDLVVLDNPTPNKKLHNV